MLELDGWNFGCRLRRREKWEVNASLTCLEFWKEKPEFWILFEGFFHPTGFTSLFLSLVTWKFPGKRFVLFGCPFSECGWWHKHGERVLKSRSFETEQVFKRVQLVVLSVCLLNDSVCAVLLRTLETPADPRLVRCVLCHFFTLGFLPRSDKRQVLLAL